MSNQVYDNIENVVDKLRQIIKSTLKTKIKSYNFAVTLIYVLTKLNRYNISNFILSEAYKKI